MHTKPHAAHTKQQQWEILDLVVHTPAFTGLAIVDNGLCVCT